MAAHQGKKRVFGHLNLVRLRTSYFDDHQVEDDRKRKCYIRFLKLIMEIVGSALASMNRSFSSRSPRQQNVGGSRPGTPVKEQRDEAELPSFYSASCEKFDQDIPSPIPALADVSSSSSSTPNHDCMFTSGDLVRSFQECGTNDSLGTEEIFFDVLWGDFEDSPKEKNPGGRPNSNQTIASVGLLAYTKDRSSDVDAPTNQSAAGIESRNPNEPSGSGNDKAFACSWQSRKQWAYAVLVFFIVIGTAVVVLFMLDVGRKSKANSQASSNMSPSEIQSVLPTPSPSRYRTPSPTLALALSPRGTFQRCRHFSLAVVRRHDRPLV